MHRRTLMKSLVTAPLLGALPAAAKSAGNPAAGRSPVRPQKLRAGMTVGLVNPASNVWEDRDIEYAADIVRSLGFKVKAGDHLFRRNQYLAGTDVERAADVNSMFADDSVDAIFCLRGGYGSLRILPLLDYGVIGANPKILLGYSDITALLNAIHHKTGLVTFHGPIAAQDFTDYTLGEFRRVLMRPEPPAPLGAPPPFEAAPGRARRKNRISRFRGGRARGRLLGGNLSLLCKLLGTPFEPDFRGRILFLEDVEEAPYRIDGMLTQLWLAGKLQQVAGIAFGKFTDADTDENTFSVEQVLRDRCAELDIPVVRGLMIGHVPDQTVVPVGALAELDGDQGTLTLLEQAVA